MKISIKKVLILSSLFIFILSAVFTYPPIKKNLNFSFQNQIPVTSVIVQHLVWQDELIFKENGSRVKRKHHTHEAEVITFIPNQKLLIKWDEWGREMFVYSNERKTYVYKPESLNIENEKKIFYKNHPSVKESGKILSINNYSILFKTNKSIQQYLKRNNAYELVQNSQVSFDKPKKIAILYIATGRYIVFWENFYKSMEKHFLPKHEKTYFLFTNHDNLKVAKNVVKIHQDQLPWPYVTLKRYHFFDAIKEELKKFDYIYFLNGDCQPVQDINEEIFPTNEQEIMVTMHSWHWLDIQRPYPYEQNKESKSYIPADKGKYYVTGAFNGGTSEGFLKMSAILKEWTDTDIQNNVIPVWHDESMLNKYLFTYFTDKNPLILFPEYVITEGFDYISAHEFPNHKMMLIDKDKKGGREYLRGITN